MKYETVGVDDLHMIENTNNEEGPAQAGPSLAYSPERAKVLRRYGLNVAQYAWLHERQDGRCAICRATSTQYFHVDHDHQTGHVRGLLCHRCNSMLGYSVDDPERLRRGAEYLDAHMAIALPDLHDEVTGGVVAKALCTCGKPKRSYRARACSVCLVELVRRDNRETRAEDRRQGRLIERGDADLLYREQDRTHCPNGHPYDGDNLYIEVTKSGQEKRHCRTCRKATMAAYYQRQKAAKVD